MVLKVVLSKQLGIFFFPFLFFHLFFFGGGGGKLNAGIK